MLHLSVKNRCHHISLPGSFVHSEWGEMRKCHPYAWPRVGARKQSFAFAFFRMSFSYFHSVIPAWQPRRACAGPDILGKECFSSLYSTSLLTMVLPKLHISDCLRLLLDSVQHKDSQINSTSRNTTRAIVWCLEHTEFFLFLIYTLIHEWMSLQGSIY